MPDIITLSEVLKEAQEVADSKQKKKGKNCKENKSGLWIHPPTSQSSLPRSCFHVIAKLTHGLDHASTNCVWKCVLHQDSLQYQLLLVPCLKHNVAPTMRVTKWVHHPPPEGLCILWWISFSWTNAVVMNIVLVDMFSKWPTCYPVKHANALSVAKAPLREDEVPWQGVLRKLTAGNGLHFVNRKIWYMEYKDTLIWPREEVWWKHSVTPTLGHFI